MGSQCEELNVSKSSPLRLGERTLVKRAATSPLGQKRPFRGAVRGAIVQSPVGDSGR
jgi:hypothetical protein